MSTFTVHLIQLNGEVSDDRDFKNANAVQPLIWRALCEKYKRPFSLLDMPLFQMLFTGELTDDEALCVAFTLDAVWVKKENIPRLVYALEVFWELYGSKDFAVTLPNVIAYLKECAAVDIRGVCFSISLVESAWSLSDPDGENERPFNFDKDKHTALGATRDQEGLEPVELGAVLATIAEEKEKGTKALLDMQEAKTGRTSSSRPNLSNIGRHD